MRSTTGGMEMNGRITAYKQNAHMEFALAGSESRPRMPYTVNASLDGTRLIVDADIQVGGTAQVVG